MDADAALALIDEWDAQGLEVAGDFGSSDIDILSSEEEELLDELLIGNVDASDDTVSEHDSSDSMLESDEDDVFVFDAHGGCGAHGQGARGWGARGRGRDARGRGRGARGCGRGAHFVNLNSYDDADAGGFADFPPFQPAGQHCLQIPDAVKITCENDFFKLYSTPQVVDSIVQFTNTYATTRIAEEYGRSYTRRSDGQWEPTTLEEIYKFLALLIFLGVFKLPEMKDYWRTTLLFDGNYA